MQACRLADIDLAVISEGKIRGLSESKNAAIFSELELSIDADIKMGITRLSEFEKRLSLFGDDILIEGELNADKKVKKLTIKGKAGKIEFRCTDIALLERKYPKTHNEEVGTVITISKPEVSLISKGVKTLGAEQVTLQVKRDGHVHVEGIDSSNDRFETELETAAEFVDEDPLPSVNSYASTTSGVFLKVLDHSVRDADSVQLMMMKSGNLGMKAYGHDLLIIPRIEI
jgi:hypothetical protein